MVSWTDAEETSCHVPHWCVWLDRRTVRASESLNQSFHLRSVAALEWDCSLRAVIGSQVSGAELGGSRLGVCGVGLRTF